MTIEQLPDFVKYLLQPTAYEPVPGAVRLVQTHISYVFIAGDYVYKFKKPVDFGFLDFTTLTKRHLYCQEEIVLNRRLCPSIYLGLVVLEKNGPTFNLADPKTADPEKTIEFGIRMKRMPEEGMMAKIIGSGSLTPEMVESICDVLVPFYATADDGVEIREYGRPEAVSVNIFENFSQTEAFIDGGALSRDQFDRIKDYSKKFLRQDDLFAERIESGRIRDCHGDLYSANICLADRVYIFDCIEFNKRFRYCDVASDIAFLAMDLDYHGLDDMSDLFVRRFINLSVDPTLDKMLNFYKCYRAYVRGKINLFTANAPEVDVQTQSRSLEMARKYFQLAERYAS